MRFVWLVLITRMAVAGDALELEPMNGPFATLPTEAAMTTKSAAIVGFADNEHYPVESWDVAIHTSRGWFTYEAPLCTGRGCSNTPIAIEPRGPLIVFSFEHDETSRTGQFSGDETGTTIVICTTAGHQPACAETAIPIRVEATGADDHDELNVTLRLNLGAVTKRHGELTLDVVDKGHTVQGSLIEADAWRDRIKALVGHHVLRLP